MTTKKMTPIQYAKHRGVSRQYISKLLKLGVIALDGGFIDMVKADEQIEQSRTPTTGNVSFSEAQRRKAVALAELRELELNFKRGLLLDKERVIQFWHVIAGGMRTRLLSIPSKLTPLLFGCKTKPEIFVCIKKAIDEALNELADERLYFKTKGGKLIAKKKNN